MAHAWWRDSDYALFDRLTKELAEVKAERDRIHTWKGVAEMEHDNLRVSLQQAEQQAAALTAKVAELEREWETSEATIREMMRVFSAEKAALMQELVRVKEQAVTISTALSDAGCPAMPLPEERPLQKMADALREKARLEQLARAPQEPETCEHSGITLRRDDAPTE